MNIIRMADKDKNIIEAMVGDTIAAYCCISERAVIGKIEKIKNGFVACGLKITPKAKKCVWLSK